MAVKTYKLRLDLRALEQVPAEDSRFVNRAQEVLQYLWDTHVAMNAGVRCFARELLLMRRGIGVWRKREGVVWGEWQPIRDCQQMDHVTSLAADDPDNVSAIINRPLLDRFSHRGADRSQCIRLANECASLVAQWCPPSEGRDLAEMPRSSLDLLSNPSSQAEGVRPGPVDAKWAIARAAAKADSWWRLSMLVRHDDAFAGAKGSAGRSRLRKALDAFRKLQEEHGSYAKAKLCLAESLPRPLWLVDRLFVRCLDEAKSFDQAVSMLCATFELADSPEDQEKSRRRYQGVWKKQRKLCPDGTWEQAREWVKGELTAGVSAYSALAEGGCLPLPGFATTDSAADTFTMDGVLLLGCGSEWKRGMWNLAGQKVRSHLGWTRRRARERAILLLHREVTQRGGWVRRTRDGRKLRAEDLALADFRFADPGSNEFELVEGVCDKPWFLRLMDYQQGEMPRQLSEAGAATDGQPVITRRMTKGWGRIRDKWLAALKGAKGASVCTDKLIDVLNAERTTAPAESGDARLFEWLARDENRFLWDGGDHGERNRCGREDRDCVAAMVRINGDFARTPRSITFTETHPTRHPAWAFFGENSAVEYWIEVKAGRPQIVFKELLMRLPDGSGYRAARVVRIPLRGYADFEASFPDVCGGEDRKISPTQALRFCDDLLGDRSLLESGLGGVKLIWDRRKLDALHGDVPASPPTDRVYVSFSCSVEPVKGGNGFLAGVVREVALRQPKDGLQRLAYLDKAVTGVSDRSGGHRPGDRVWPTDLDMTGCRLLSVDQGLRIAASGTVWRLADVPAGSSPWRLGTKANDLPLYAEAGGVREVRLPGDDEPLPEQWRGLQDRFYRIRSRLNLQNALMRIARLLAAGTFTTRRVEARERNRKSRGFVAPVSPRYVMVEELLSSDDVRANCEKACEQLLRWSTTDSMQECLAAIGHGGSIWEWLAAADGSLREVGMAVPQTVVPTVAAAKADGREAERAKLVLKRNDEERRFADVVHKHRKRLSAALCGGYDAGKHRRATDGLWAKLDCALQKEISYGQDGSGMLPLLRRPAARKHHAKIDRHHLPLGDSLRGGLSLKRLEFLEEVRDFVRKWSCRPRWPGDIRRLGEDEEFGKKDRSHIEHIRDHRVKLVAHSIVAAALGFEQDLRRGLWRCRTASGEMLWHHPESKRFFREGDGGVLEQVAIPDGHDDVWASRPHPIHAPCQLIVFEDLGRYRFRQDRPRQENSKLSKWSHRQVLHMTQHIAGLFGVPIAIVPAAYSSRFCSRCGAPGFRGSRFDPRWLAQDWLKRIRGSSDIRYKGMQDTADSVECQLVGSPDALAKEESRPWVLQPGGTHFICGNSACSCHRRPINADENASANIGRWFLRGRDEFTIRVSKALTPLRPLKWMPLDRFEEQDGHYVGVIGKPARRVRGEEDDDAVADSDGITLFRDPSGGVAGMRPDWWFERVVFWGRVAVQCAKGVRAANADMYEPRD